MSLRLRDALLLVLLVLAGLGLRMRDLEAHRPSPDEGNYMNSARLHVIGREGDLGRWLGQDRRWAGELARDFWRAENKTTYPHGYVEQLTMRWAYRLGASSFASVRFSSALLGALLPLVLYLAARRMRFSRVAGLAAGGLAALSLVFVWYSRTGWGQIGCTFFYVAWLGLAWSLFDPGARHTRAAYVQLGLGLAATSVLAYGWHEMIVVQVGWMGLFAGLAPLLVRARSQERGGGYLARLFKSPRTWTLSASAVPVAVLFVTLLFSPWAQKTWFASNLEGTQYTTLERYRLAARWLFEVVSVQDQLGYPLLALAAIGVVTTFARRRVLFVFLMMSGLGSALMLFLKFNLPHLVRIYLPAFAVLLLFAGQGFATLVDLAYRKRVRWVSWAVGVPLFAYLGAATWQTLFAPLDAPLAVRPIDFAEAQGRDPRHAEEPILRVLDVQLTEDEPVGVFQSFEMRFRVLDRGHRAHMFNPPEGRPFPDEVPRFVIAVPASFLGLMNANYGSEHPYAEVVRDNVDRFALFRLREPR